MSERIREVMNSVGFYIAENNSEVTSKEVEFLCERLVKACAKFSYDYTSDETNREYYEDLGWDCLPNDLRSAMLEHFGVKQ